MPFRLITAQAGGQVIAPSTVALLLQAPIGSTPDPS
jgi:hypothetical protein